MAEVAKISFDFFHRIKLSIQFAKNMYWATFWADIFSQSHPVTLIPGRLDDKRQGHDAELPARHLRHVGHLHHQEPRGQVHRGNRLKSWRQQSFGECRSNFLLIFKIYF
jgi:hypothetical protein